MSNAVQAIKTRCGEFFSIAKATWEDETGAYYISEFASSILDLYQEAAKSKPFLVAGAQKLIRTYIDITFAQDLGAKIESWLTTDSKGRHLWEKSPSQVIYNSITTLYSFLSGIYLLESFELIKLGKAAAPLNMITTAIQISMCSLELFESGKTVIKCREKIKKSRIKEAEWKKRADWQATDLKQLYAKKLGKWSSQISSGKLKTYQLSRAIGKKKHYENLTQENSLETLREHAKQKVSKWKEAENKYETNKKKAFAYIVCDVAYLGLLIFSASCEYLAIQLPLTFAVTNFLCNALFVGYVLWEKKLDLQKGGEKCTV